MFIEIPITCFCLSDRLRYLRDLTTEHAAEPEATHDHPHQNPFNRRKYVDDIGGCFDVGAKEREDCDTRIRP